MHHNALCAGASIKREKGGMRKWQHRCTLTRANRLIWPHSAHNSAAYNCPMQQHLHKSGSKLYRTYQCGQASRYGMAGPGEVRL